MNSRPLWTVGGGICHHEFLIKYNSDQKNYFDTLNNAFDTVYDSMYGFGWSGGRASRPRDAISLEALGFLIQAYNDQGVGFNFAFSNILLTEKDLEDPHCNYALELANKSKLNGVIVASPLLFEYVTKTYPNLNITWSVTTGMNTPEMYNEKCDDKRIKYVVLHPDFNHDTKFLTQLKQPEKIEIMVNDHCVFGCPFRAQHYKEVSQMCLNQVNNPFVYNRKDLDGAPTSMFELPGPGSTCRALKAGMERDNRNVLTFSDIDNMRNMGFKCFKIIGREFNTKHFEDEIKPYIEQYWIRGLVKKAGENIHI